MDLTGKRVTLHDMSLRDGMHPKQHQISLAQMVAVSTALDAAGIPLIEVTHGDGLGGASINYGFPMHSDEEYLRAVVPKMKRARISALTLPGIGTVDDLRMAVDCGVGTIRVATHCTEADVSAQHIGMARKLGVDTVGFLMMAHMIPAEALLVQAKKMESYGAQVIYCTDSAGYMLPDDVTARIGLLRRELAPATEVGFHGHHNMGMGIANSLAAIEAGAARIDGSVAGLGAGAGNTPLEVFLAVIDRMGALHGCDLFKLMDVAEDLIVPMMDTPVRIDRDALILGYAGVYSSFLLFAKRAAERYGVPSRDILVELGKRKTVGGQEDMIEDLALDMARAKRGQLMDLAAFREDTRRWLDENCPRSLRTPGNEEDVTWGGQRTPLPSADAGLWLERAAARGFTAPTWPREYGGGGLTREQAAVLAEEMRRLGCRAPLKSFGIWMLGPVLLKHGSEAHKREHLPRIVRGEIRWCQGYSEPAAGSDLASLQMRAARDGDDFVVSGQKIWTSHADKSDWMFCLVRTDPAAPKHEGISFILIDMQSPGISVRPIRLISGASPFCETFFDDVRVPAGNLVGPAGGGWRIAKDLLEFERSAISELREAATSDEEPLEELAKRYVGVADGVLADPALRDRITQANMDFLCSKLTLRRSAESIQAGRGPGTETSMFKLYATELNKRRKELKVLIAGFQGLGWEGDPFNESELLYTREWLRSRANSIEGGSSEIQLNIIAKRVLGLPD